MLVLTRKKDEVIMIGDNVEIVVVETRGDMVKLGIRAPKDVAIHRKEVYQEIQNENRNAVVSGGVVPDFDKIMEIMKKDGRS